jgi:hypothetical protein
MKQFWPHISYITWTQNAGVGSASVGDAPFDVSNVVARGVELTDGGALLSHKIMSRCSLYDARIWTSTVDVLAIFSENNLSAIKSVESFLALFGRNIGLEEAD